MQIVGRCSPVFAQTGERAGDTIAVEALQSCQNTEIGIKEDIVI